MRSSMRTRCLPPHSTDAPAAWLLPDVKWIETSAVQLTQQHAHCVRRPLPVRHTCWQHFAKSQVHSCACCRTCCPDSLQAEPRRCCAVALQAVHLALLRRVKQRECITPNACTDESGRHTTAVEAALSHHTTAARTCISRGACILLPAVAAVSEPCLAQSVLPGTRATASDACYI
jgi:hypothetical protein